jgi:hypothetical protein
MNKYTGKFFVAYPDDDTAKLALTLLKECDARGVVLEPGAGLGEGMILLFSADPEHAAFFGQGYYTSSRKRMGDWELELPKHAESAGGLAAHAKEGQARNNFQKALLFLEPRLRKKSPKPEK